MSIDLEAQVLAVAEAMRERDAELEAAYKRHYRSENREYEKQRSKIFYIRNIDRILLQKKAYQAKNSNAIAERNKAYRAKNSHAVAEQKKAYRAKKMSERVLVGRRKGESHPGAKLNDDLVRIIRSRSGAGESLRKIAENLGVSRGAVSHVLSGETWAHVI